MASDTILAEHAKDMTDLFLGPMPIEKFLDTFLPLPPDLQKTMPKKFKLSFKGVPDDDAIHQYEPFMNAVNGAEIFDGCALVRSVYNYGTDYDRANTWPDVIYRRCTTSTDFNASTGRPWPPSESWEWAWTEIGFHFRDYNADVFHEGREGVGQDGRYLVNVSVDQKDLGWLVFYATAQMACHHRVFVFSVLVCGETARLIRWDRSGAVVSEHFEYQRHPQLIAQFLWRYTHLSLTERGYDTSVELATEQEAQFMSEALQIHESSRKRQLPEICNAQSLLREDYVTYKAKVDHVWPGNVYDAVSSSRDSTYLIRQPIWPSFSPVGRSNRTYVAVDLKTGSIVLLKDSWRTDEEKNSEAHIYKVFKSSMDTDELKFLPAVIAAGDVRDMEGRHQRTEVQQLADNSEMNWFPVAQMGTRIHHRIVQRLAYPLNTFASARELVQAVRDCMSAVIRVYKQFGRVHGDVSVASVMLNEEGRGIMNDWDLSRVVNHHGDQKAMTEENSRMATWQFMSIALLMNPSRSHTIMDNLESFYWTLTYIGFHYLEHDSSRSILDMYDERDITPAARNNARGFDTGGNGKLAFLHRHEDPGFTCMPFNNLVSQLRSLFKKYHLLSGDRNNAALSGIEERILVDEALRHFDDALDVEEWPNQSRCEEDQFPPQPMWMLEWANPRHLNRT